MKSQASKIAEIARFTANLKIYTSKGADSFACFVYWFERYKLEKKNKTIKEICFLAKTKSCYRELRAQNHYYSEERKENACRKIRGKIYLETSPGNPTPIKRGKKLNKKIKNKIMEHWRNLLFPTGKKWFSEEFNEIRDCNSHRSNNLLSYKK